MNRPQIAGDAMTEPLDLDAIEDSYVGYDPDYPIFRLIAAVRERDAEIARLRAPPGADVHALAAEVLGDWRGRLALALQQYGDERAQEAADQAEESVPQLASEEYIDSLPEDDRVHYKADAPPGADAKERAERLAEQMVGLYGEPFIEEIARALQQYGDERAAAAIESLREPTVAMRIAGDHFEGDTVGTWRAMFNAALAAKPGSET